MNDRMSYELIARVAHEVNRAYCESIGDNSQKPWDEYPVDQQVLVQELVETHAAYPNVTPEDSHNNWMSEKFKAGWIYGPVKDEASKTHPCMLPYRELPTDQKTKDYLFKSVCDTLIPYIPSVQIKEEENDG